MPDPDDTTDPDTSRTDAAGYDIEPPPTPPHQPGHPGLQDQPAPEQEGWREFDANASWTGSDAYPARTEAPVDDSLTDDLPTPTEDPDLLAAITAAIDDDAMVDVADLSVERRGGTIFLRGSAATPQDRHRAGDIAAAFAGVQHVENLLGAGDGAEIGRLAREERPEELIDPTSDA